VSGDSAGRRSNGAAAHQPRSQANSSGWKQGDYRTNSQSDKKAGRCTVTSRFLYPFNNFDLSVGPAGEHCCIIRIDDPKIGVKLANGIVVSECIRFIVVLVSENNKRI
jgi:hypothetical protein